MSTAAPASPPHAQSSSAQFLGAVTRGTESATQSSTPTRSSSGTAAPAIAVQPTWELPHSAVDLAPAAYLVGLVKERTLFFTTHGSRMYSIIGQMSACKLLGDALGSPKEEVAQAWSKLRALSDEDRETMVWDLWGHRLERRVPIADREPAFNFVYELFEPTGLNLLEAVAKVLHDLTVDECLAWCAALRPRRPAWLPPPPPPTRPQPRRRAPRRDAHGDVDGKINETWFVKRALEFAGRYMVKQKLLKDYHTRATGGRDCVVFGGCCLHSYKLKAGRVERWHRLLPCTACVLKLGSTRGALPSRLPSRSCLHCAPAPHRRAHAPHRRARRASPQAVTGCAALARIRASLRTRSARPAARWRTRRSGTPADLEAKRIL